MAESKYLIKKCTLIPIESSLPEDKPYEAELLEDSVRTIGLATLVLPLFIGAFVFFVL